MNNNNNNNNNDNHILHSYVGQCFWTYCLPSIWDRIIRIVGLCYFLRSVYVYKTSVQLAFTLIQYVHTYLSFILHYVGVVCVGPDFCVLYSFQLNHFFSKSLDGPEKGRFC